jgi:hypothetical protein
MECTQIESGAAYDQGRVSPTKDITYGAISILNKSKSRIPLTWFDHVKQMERDSLPLFESGFSGANVKMSDYLTRVGRDYLDWILLSQFQGGLGLARSGRAADDRQSAIFSHARTACPDQPG